MIQLLPKPDKFPECPAKLSRTYCLTAIAVVNDKQTMEELGEETAEFYSMILYLMLHGH